MEIVHDAPTNVAAQTSERRKHSTGKVDFPIRVVYQRGVEFIARGKVRRVMRGQLWAGVASEVWETTPNKGPREPQCQLKWGNCHLPDKPSKEQHWRQETRQLSES